MGRSERADQDTPECRLATAALADDAGRTPLLDGEIQGRKRGDGAPRIPHLGAGKLDDRAHCITSSERQHAAAPPPSTAAQRRHLAALIDRIPAARRERAPARPIQQTRGGAGNRDESLRAACERRTRADQGRGVRVGGVAEDASRRASLDHPSGVHDHHAVGYRLDHGEVVRDEDEGHARLAAQPVEQLEDAPLHRDVECGRRLVGEQ